MKKLLLCGCVTFLGLVIAFPSLAAPTKVKGVKVKKIKSNAATVSWNSTSGAYQYVVKVRKKKSKKLVKTVKTTSTSTMVKGLKKKKWYRVTVKAKDYYGNAGKRSKAKVFKTKSWRNYHSNKYGFSLDFPKEWKGYRVNIQTGYDGTYINFKLKSNVMNEWYTLFSILAFDVADADDLYEYYGTPLATGDDYVFYWMHAQDTASDLYARAQEITTVLATIKTD